MNKSTHEQLHSDVQPRVLVADGGALLWWWVAGAFALVIFAWVTVIVIAQQNRVQSVPLEHRTEGGR